MGLEASLMPYESKKARERSRAFSVPYGTYFFFAPAKASVVLLARSLDPEFPVLALPWPAALEGHQRADGILALAGRDVDADEEPRHRGQAQVAAQRVHRVERPLIGRERFEAEALEQVPGIPLGQIG